MTPLREEHARVLENELIAEEEARVVEASSSNTARQRGDEQANTSPDFRSELAATEARFLQIVANLQREREADAKKHERAQEETRLQISQLQARVRKLEEPAFKLNCGSPTTWLARRLGS
ncbi:hypothetical protein DACRYDRAFT_22111 [Dacryopinax primogenitus]|uniref:Uncharacterized protein n=1 Tax=Dacryopinax primogenitus (strain DJM 731) TaxID=1858805 RepID=M5G9D8_DACPD|nr:uncharacterized protein DACRYDRAFT_22111 [Dacryopinax primogenitus]EJU02477.1 hypothetical protein DACRYDRAFT_22111 [Dacryopinax primogenitus]